MDKDAFLEHEANGPGKHEFLHVTPGLGHSLGREGVVDGGHVLGDDRAVVEFSRHEVGRRADEFHAPGEGLPVGARAGEGR